MCIRDRAKDAQLKAFSVELSRMDMSVVQKDALKQRFAKVRKALDTELKARAAADVKAAQEAVNKFFTEQPDARVMVAKLDVDASSKALQSGIAAARKVNKPVYLFAQDKSGVDPCKTLFSNYVPQDVQAAGIDAVAWNKVVCEQLQARGGGKPEGAQGQGEAPRAALEGVMKLAEEFFRMKVGP